ncbi:hypothetical protein EDB85DRAFT_1960134, partial [Lactarius pseudohatsudake]
MRQISHGPPIRRRERSGASEFENRLDRAYLKTSQIDHQLQGKSDSQKVLSQSSFRHLVLSHYCRRVGSSSISLVDVLLDLVTHKIYHIEGRPSEGGRAVIVDTIATKTFSAPSGMPLQS